MKIVKRSEFYAGYIILYAYKFLRYVCKFWGCHKSSVFEVLFLRVTSTLKIHIFHEHYQLWHHHALLLVTFSQDVYVHLMLWNCPQDIPLITIGGIQNGWLTWMRWRHFWDYLSGCSGKLETELPSSLASAKLVSCGQTTIFLKGVIAFSISARKNIGSGVVSIAKLLLTLPSQSEMLKCLLNLP